VKTVLKIVGVVIALLIVIAIAIPLFINVNNYRPQIESSIGSALGRQVKVGNLSLSLLSGSVQADQLSISDDPNFSNAPFVQAKTLKVGVELMPLIFSKQLHITELIIEQPEMVLLRDRDGKWNFSSIGNQSSRSAKPAEKSGSSPGPGDVSVAKLELTDGKVTLGSVPARRKPIVYDKVNVSVKNFSFANPFPVVASVGLPSGGSLKIDGTAGPINTTDTTLTPVQAKITMNKLDLSQSALVDPALGITGFADFDGTLSSDGHIAKANGTVKGTSLKLVPKGSPSPQPIQVVFVLDHDLQKETGNLTQGDIGIGKALAKLTGTYNMQGDMTSVNMKLNGQAMPVDDLEAVLPAVGVTLPTGSKLKGGTLSVDLSTVGPLDKLVTTGTVRMSNSALAGFSLGSKLSAIPGLAGHQSGNDTVIQNMSANVRYSPEGAKLDNIDVVVPSLATVTGAGTVSPSNQLDFKVVASLNGGALGDVSKLAGMSSGKGGIPVTIGGTTSNPTFTPDMKGIVGNQLKGLVPAGKTNPLGGLGGLLGKKKPN
jgi:AsmA protein